MSDLILTAIAIAMLIPMAICFFLGLLLIILVVSERYDK